MKSKPMLTVADVDAIVAGARAEAVRNNWAVSISVVDDGGHLLAMVRLDGASPMTAQMSVEKAHTAALGRRESLFYEEIINKGRFAFLSAPKLRAMIEGAVPIQFEGVVVGAVGVSGVRSSEDAQIARAGIAAAGLAT